MDKGVRQTDPEDVRGCGQPRGPRRKELPGLASPFSQGIPSGARLSGWGWRPGTGAAVGRGSARSLGMEVNIQYRVATKQADEPLFGPDSTVR